ncbi:MAG: carbonic anhydrase family protein [Pseudomonadota bacterium]
MLASRLSFILVGLFFSLNGPLGATVGDWQTIIAGKSETIDINKASIERTTSGATAWSRVMLERPVSDVGGAYDAMQAQNLYDCAARRFTTLRRAYFRGDTLVREDVVSRQRPNAIEVGSLDERIFNVACATTANGSANAGVVPAGVPAATGAALDHVVAPPLLSQAGNEGSVTANLTLVADRGAVVAAETPKLIILPSIDKTAADKAAADQAAASAGKKPLAASPAPLAPKVGSSSLRQGVESLADKRLRELHYAASGPHKAIKKRSTAAFLVNDQDGLSASKIGAWSYDDEGGPTRWAKLRDDYAVCAAGKRQSPIDIREGIKVNLEEITFDYKSRPFRIIDTGHTVQVNVGEGSSLKISGRRYELLYFNFHRPSEERVDGRAYDMVMHLVHKNDEGQFAVVAVLLEKGGENSLIQTLWNNLPLDQNIEVAPVDVIDLNKILPESRAYWTYMGSLTTPPCTEGVLWMVLKQPIPVSAEQVAIFSRLYRNNARPLQPSNGRLIKESR